MLWASDAWTVAPTQAKLDKLEALTAFFDVTAEEDE